MAKIGPMSEPHMRVFLHRDKPNLVGFPHKKYFQNPLYTLNLEAHHMGQYLQGIKNWLEFSMVKIHAIPDIHRSTFFHADKANLVGFYIKKYFQDPLYTLNLETHHVGQYLQGKKIGWNFQWLRNTQYPISIEVPFFMPIRQIQSDFTSKNISRIHFTH